MSGTRPTGPPALSRGTVDRAALYRTDDAWLAAAWRNPRSRVLVLDGGRALVREGRPRPRLVLVAPEEAPAGDRFLLGVDGDRAYWAVTGPLPPVPRCRPTGLREIGALLDDGDAGLLVHAVALANWHATHPRCPRCGGRTAPTKAGHTRLCGADGSEHFPRSDPAVIMLVHDGAERCVLGRQRAWPPGRFSTLAGFVEPGESAEQAVAREIAEEVGLDVTDIEYRSSQPWPFPSSLMLGFTARVTGAGLARDGNLAVDLEEVEDARWFTRDEVRAAAPWSEANDRFGLPPAVSIAWRLITDWAHQR